MSRLLPAAVCSLICIASTSAPAADEPAIPPPPPTPTYDSVPALPAMPDGAVHSPAPRFMEPATQYCPAPASPYDAGYYWYRPEAVVPGANAGLHLRHPYYSYRRPWYPAGPASVNVTIIW